MIINLLLLTAFVAPWFFMLARLKNMGYHADKASAKRLYQDFGACIATLTLMAGIIGVVSDVLFNLVVGSVVFREIPREFLFTQRVKRWADRAEEQTPLIRTRREDKGVLWKDRLNTIMPGHV